MTRPYRRQHVFDVSELVRDRRLLLRMSQSDLARRIGVTTCTVSNIELGVTGPHGSTLLLLMRELGITLDEVMTCLREVET